MASRRKGGLDIAFQALSEHVRAVRERQKQSPSQELDPADLTSVVRAADALRAIEFDRVMVVMRAARHRLPSMTPDELKELLSCIDPSEDGWEVGNAC